MMMRWMQGGLGGTLGQLDSQGLAWLPTVANFITLACFACSLLLANTFVEVRPSPLLTISNDQTLDV